MAGLAFHAMGRELLVRVVVFAAGTFTVAAVSAILFIR
jgi:hypothetical protein